MYDMFRKSGNKNIYILEAANLEIADMQFNFLITCFLLVIFSPKRYITLHVYVYY